MPSVRHFTANFASRASLFGQIKGFCATLLPQRNIKIARMGDILRTMALVGQTTVRQGNWESS
jgi:hypothetical protein